MQEQNLQIYPTGIKPVINVSQNDVGRQFQLVLYDGTSAYSLPSGTTARIDGIKPDRKGFSYFDAVAVSGNVVTVTTKQQMTIVAGTVECEIRFSNGGDDIGTLNFKMMVEPSPINEDTDISETDLPAVIEQGRQNMLNSEAWAKGTKNGIAVGSSEPQYHNNSKYHSEQAASSASTASTAATNAANSASTASTKASEASASATNAANSAATAAAWSAHPPYIGANGNWYVWNTNTSAYVDSGVDASITVQIADVTMLATTATPYVTNTGTNTDPIFHLFVPKGAGIASIEKTGTSGLVDTYTITFTDGQTTTFDVTNGAAGRGIASITKTGTAGLVDTYTITYTDGTTSTYDVTNGQDGTGATLQTLADVNITNLTDGDILAYNSTNRKFENEALAAVARTGSYSDLSNKPTLGTAAAKDSTNAITQSSTDLIESGAVYTETQSIRQALSNEEITRSKVSAHNLIPMSLSWIKENNTSGTWTGNAYERNGITFTVNTDSNGIISSISVQGTAQSVMAFYLGAKDFGNTELSSYGGYETANGYTISSGRTDDSSARYLGYNNENKIIFIAIASGQAISTAITYYPMIRLASDPCTEYTPYAMTNRELSNEISNLSSNKVGFVLNNQYFTQGNWAGADSVNIPANRMVHVKFASTNGSEAWLGINGPHIAFTTSTDPIDYVFAVKEITVISCSANGRVDWSSTPMK